MVHIPERAVLEYQNVSRLYLSIFFGFYFWHIKSTRYRLRNILRYVMQTLNPVNSKLAKYAALVILANLYICHHTKSGPKLHFPDLLSKIVQLWKRGRSARILADCSVGIQKIVSQLAICRTFARMDFSRQRSAKIQNSLTVY